MNLKYLGTLQKYFRQRAILSNLYEKIECTTTMDIFLISRSRCLNLIFQFSKQRNGFSISLSSEKLSDWQCTDWIKVVILTLAFRNGSFVTFMFCPKTCNLLIITTFWGFNVSKRQESGFQTIFASCNFIDSILE